MTTAPTRKHQQASIELSRQIEWFTPGENLLDVFLLDNNGKYQLNQKYIQSDKVKVSIFDDLYISLEVVFLDD